MLMDNASIHHLERVEEMITGVGARLHFLPPYSPDLMPIEEVFAKQNATSQNMTHCLELLQLQKLLLK